jgi:large subunit ribosomal protein L21
MSSNMFAIIRTGGKQYRVQAGDTVRVASIDKKPGDTFDLTEVLMVGGDSSVIGTPLVKDAKVSVTVVKQGQAAKITVFKKKRRQGYRRTHGHRQDFTELFISAITAPGGAPVKADTKPHVIDPAKKLARIEAHTAKLKAAGGKALVEAKAKKAAVSNQVKSKKKAASHKKAMAKKAAPKTKKSAAAKKTKKKTAKKVSKK